MYHEPSVLSLGEGFLSRKRRSTDSSKPTKGQTTPASKLACLTLCRQGHGLIERLLEKLTLLLVQLLLQPMKFLFAKWFRYFSPKFLRGFNPIDDSGFCVCKSFLRGSSIDRHAGQLVNAGKPSLFVFTVNGEK